MGDEGTGWKAPRWRFVLALSAALVVHVGLLLAVRAALSWRPSFDSRTTTVMQLRLIDVEVLPPPVPEPVPESSPASSPSRPVTPGTPAQAVASPAPAAKPPKATSDAVGAPSNLDLGSVPETIVAAPASSEPASGERASTPIQNPIVGPDIFGAPASQPIAIRREHQPRLVTPDGRTYLPEVDVAVAAAATRFPDKPKAPTASGSDPFSHRSPIPYVATRFDPLWVPAGETLVDTFLRRMTKRSSSQIGGLQIDCVWILIVAGCNWGPIQRMSIDELKRLRADVPMPRGPGTRPGD